VVASGYYFPTVRGGGERVFRPPRPPAALGAVLGDLAALVRGGVFLHTPEPDDCTFCEFGRACGPDPTGRAERKLKAPGAVLESYRRLRAHE
jgi:hypothetical protein